MRREDKMWSRQKSDKASRAKRTELQRAVQNGELIKVMDLAARKGRPRKHLEKVISYAKEDVIVHKDMMEWSPSLSNGDLNQSTAMLHEHETQQVASWTTPWIATFNATPYDAYNTQYPETVFADTKMLELGENTVAMGVPSMQMPQQWTNTAWALPQQTYANDICGDIGVCEATPRAEPQPNLPEWMNTCYPDDRLTKLPRDFTDLSFYEFDADMEPLGAGETAKVNGSVKDYRDALNIGILQVPIRPLAPIARAEIKMADMRYEFASEYTEDETMADGTEQIEDLEESIVIPAISSDQVPTSSSVSESNVSTPASADTEEEVPIEQVPIEHNLLSLPETERALVAQTPQTKPLDKESEESLSEQKSPDEECLVSTHESQGDDKLSVGSNDEDRASDQSQYDHPKVQHAYRQKQKRAKDQKHDIFRAELKRTALQLGKSHWKGNIDSNIAAQFHRLAETGWNHLEPREVVALLPPQLRTSLWS
ncbi:hypothetical protein PILCRDRAFT_128190 [Piloderma croceum F 1598]|uniref:Uncharacterized protein n=1 Tax=Piloderma croceum (strain F 1598) TaxID=765440 RepID=A0A0C3GIB4_PILCF|nr:hypothetical protein PILCRDRAFT_128190 [Piloderma croceum F 1598]